MSHPFVWSNVRGCWWPGSEILFRQVITSTQLLTYFDFLAQLRKQCLEGFLKKTHVFIHRFKLDPWFRSNREMPDVSWLNWSLWDCDEKGYRCTFLSTLKSKVVFIELDVWWFFKSKNISPSLRKLPGVQCPFKLLSSWPEMSRFLTKWLALDNEWILSIYHFKHPDCVDICFFLFLFLLLDATLWTFWLQEIWRKITFSEFRKLLQASLFMSKDDVWDITLNQTMIFSVLYLIFFLVDNKVLLSAHQKCNKGCNEAGSESIFLQYHIFHRHKVIHTSFPLLRTLCFGIIFSCRGFHGGTTI